CWYTNPKKFAKAAAYSGCHHRSMDLNQFLSFSVTSSTGIPITSSYPPISPIPNRLLGSLKPEIVNSPNSALSTHFDSDNLSSALSDSQEQHTSAVWCQLLKEIIICIDQSHLWTISKTVCIYLLGAFFHRREVKTMKPNMHCWN
ncbi:hypothetical protein CR513_43257, partial [Mucuna pruriens]